MVTFVPIFLWNNFTTFMSREDPRLWFVYYFIYCIHMYKIFASLCVMVMYTLKVTIMSTEATRQQSLNYGCMVISRPQFTVDHYVEKPNSYISSVINCGVYVCSMDIFQEMAGVFNRKQNDIYNKWGFIFLLHCFNITFFDYFWKIVTLYFACNFNHLCIWKTKFNHMYIKYLFRMNVCIYMYVRRIAMIC